MVVTTEDHIGTSAYLDSERGNFKLFGLKYFRKFELFGARLLKKRA